MTNDDVKKHWDGSATESMYDKNLLELEITAILEQLRPEDRVLDVGCGEGEGTARYFGKVKSILGVDYSDTRLDKLKEANSGISTLRMDMRELSPDLFNPLFSTVITQRSLINLKDFGEQRQMITRIHSLLENGGRYIMLEGFAEGVESVNRIRRDFCLPDIGVKWHNCFIKKNLLLDFVRGRFELVHSRDFSLYFFLTRVFNAILRHPEVPKWDEAVNRLARDMEIRCGNRFMSGVSRLELLVFRKI
jgi:SAM-dependent methyltransferase